MFNPHTGKGFWLFGGLVHSKEALHSILAVQKPPLKVMEIPSDGDLEMKGKSCVFW